MFVGGSVNAVRSENKRRVSDVVDILLFLAEFVQDRSRSVKLLDRLLGGRPGLHDHLWARDFRHGVFLPHPNADWTGSKHSTTSWRHSSIRPTKLLCMSRTSREQMARFRLRLGENEPFGLINVGDASALCKLCEEHPELVVSDKEFSGSLFAGLDQDDSTVNVLIGSKKFTEGWNSWRVSTMGLMNVGKGEGSEIIQLFGRGVRLKGYGMSLKRSSVLDDVERPEHIGILETLNIFGIRADYMRQFKEYLEEEGLPSNEERIEFILPVVKNLDGKKLTTIRLKDGVDFKRQGPKPTLDEPPDVLLRHPVTLNWYPKIQAEQSKELRTTSDIAVLDECSFEEKHLAFMDIDVDLLRVAATSRTSGRGTTSICPVRCHNEAAAVAAVVSAAYPPAEMQFTRFDQVRRWEEIAVALLKKYIDRYYKHRKRNGKPDYLEYHELREDDPELRPAIPPAHRAIAASHR